LDSRELGEEEDEGLEDEKMRESPAKRQRQIGRHSRRKKEEEGNQGESGGLANGHHEQEGQEGGVKQQAVAAAGSNLENSRGEEGGSRGPAAVEDGSLPYDYMAIGTSGRTGGSAGIEGNMQGENMTDPPQKAVRGSRKAAAATAKQKGAAGESGDGRKGMEVHICFIG
jgi:hypothetical protein